MNRHQAFGSAATLGVVVAIALGFWNLGGHGRQRDISADQKRSEDLGRISMDINQWYARQKKLPADLNALTTYDPGLRLGDPLTEVAYEYKLAGDTEYQLCATFALDGAHEPANRFRRPMFHFHKAGRQCFNVDAVRMNLYP